MLWHCMKRQLKVAHTVTTCSFSDMDVRSSTHKEIIEGDIEASLSLFESNDIKVYHTPLLPSFVFDEEGGHVVTPVG